jgi:CheY-like chemotaxis protein
LSVHFGEVDCAEIVAIRPEEDRSAGHALHEGRMDDDIISLRILVVSEAAAERELIRLAASEASVPIEVVEVEAAADATAACELLERDGAFDAVFFDSRMPRSARQAVLDAVHSSSGRPLAILIGAAAIKTREVLTDGLAVDSVLAKPIDAQELRQLIETCIRARLPKRVLIVDSSATVRSVIRKVIQASRFKLEPEEAGAGTAAIEQANKQAFDMIFMDCHMPDPDGFATLRELKRSQPDIKVVMITGTRDARIEDRARAEGAKDFLYKPFFAKDIDAMLNRVFGLMRPRWN